MRIKRVFPRKSHQSTRLARAVEIIRTGGKKSADDYIKLQELYDKHQAAKYKLGEARERHRTWGNANTASALYKAKAEFEFYDNNLSALQREANSRSAKARHLLKLRKKVNALRKKGFIVKRKK